MRSLDPLPGADAPGAPPGSGSQAGGAGELAPGIGSIQQEVQLTPEQIKQRLEEELADQCTWIIEKFNSLHKIVYRRPRYESYISHAMAKFTELAFNDPHFNDVNTKSIGRVINACNSSERVKLTKYVPSFKQFIERLRSIVRGIDEGEIISDEEERDTYAELVRDLRSRSMTFEEFLLSMEDILQTLYDIDRDDEYKLVFHSLVSDMYKALVGDNRLKRTLEREIVRLARRKRGMSEREAERILECLPNSPYWSKYSFCSPA